MSRERKRLYVCLLVSAKAFAAVTAESFVLLRCAERHVRLHEALGEFAFLLLRKSTRRERNHTRKQNENYWSGKTHGQTNPTTLRHCPDAKSYSVCRFVGLTPW